jgi:hypothetical protein
MTLAVCLGSGMLVDIASVTPEKHLETRKAPS